MSNTPPSILVLTKDEERNIANCLRSLRFSDDIVILDSHSTDRTVEIARSFPNVRIYRRPFDTEYKQRNYGLHDIPYKHPWLYVCDADETVPRELSAEIIERTNDPACPHSAFRLRYENMFMNKHLRYASGQSVWITRLMRPERLTYEIRATNVHPIVRGTVGELKKTFVHHSFNSGLKRWFQKHNFYSSREAEEGVRVRRLPLPGWSSLMSGDTMSRRRSFKNLSYFLKARALWRFLHSYIFNAGWLDGTPGLQYCCMISMYEYWIELKMREIERTWHDTTLAKAQRMLEEDQA